MEITYWQAALLGLIQGLTEFIPVSSSAHLNIAHWLMGADERNLTFDVMLHVGTLFALVVYFWKDWIGLLFNPEMAKLRNLIFLACAPAVLVGVALRDLQETTVFADVRFNAVMLVVMGALLLWADRIGRKRRELTQTNWKDALVIGCSQALALVPGVSRSGATITAGLFRRLNREAAARFSFLMSVPITFGAAGYEFYGEIIKADNTREVAANLDVIVVGVLVSALSGFWAIGFMLNYLKTRDVSLFVWWRVFVAVLVFALWPFLRSG